jgi:hypothetical protein
VNLLVTIPNEEIQWDFHISHNFLGCLVIEGCDVY